MGNQVPAIQPFSSPPPLPALIRQNNKVLPSKQMLVLCSPSVQGGHRELPRRSLLLLWHLVVSHRRGRDLEREDRVTCRDIPSAEPKHTGPTAPLPPPAPLAAVSGGLGKMRNQNQGPPNRQHSGFRKNWSTGLLQQKVSWTVSTREGQLMPKQEQPKAFPTTLME